LGLEQTSISRSEILDLQQRVAKMEHIFADYQFFKQEVTTSIQSVESRLSSHFEGYQRQVDDLLHHFSGFELEMAKCKSLLDAPLGGPPQQKVVGDDMLAWTNRMHHTVSELLLGLQHVHGLVQAHEHNFKFKFLDNDTKGPHPDFSAEIAKVNHLEHLFQRLVSQVSSCEGNAHDIAMIKNSMEASKKEIHSKINFLHQRIHLEVANVKRSSPPNSNVFEGFDPSSSSQVPTLQPGSAPMPIGQGQSQPHSL
jgi:hypothetical protein